MKQTVFIYNFARSAIIFVFLLLLPVLARAADGAGMLAPDGPVTPLSPYLDFFIDDTFSMDIEEVAAPARAASFQPFDLNKLPNTEGATWLRFTLAPAPPGNRPNVWLLDMGQDIPGEPLLYDQQRNELSGAMEWHESQPGQRGILLLPEMTQEPATCYIRLSGLPGPWFAPLARSPRNAASNWASLSRTGATLALAVVMLLCLLRAMGESGQWRVWTGLYVGVALGQALLGMPALGDGFSLVRLCAILAPGIALMLMPHVGRHLLASPQTSRSLDIQLLLLSLPGAALALCPLLPGWSWLDRWLGLWPLGLAIILPTAIGAWIMGLTGSRRFLIACGLPPFFTAFAYYGLDFGLPANLLASLPLWSIALGALVLVSARSPGSGLPTAGPDDPLARSDSIINLEKPLDDPNLRIVSGNTRLPVGAATWGEPDDDPLGEDLPFDDEPSDAREAALRLPVDEILREGAALGHCSLPATARQYAERMISASERLAAMLGNPDYVSGEEEAGQNGQAKEESFNLQKVLREAHDYAATAAERSSISLSWYMPPHLYQQYRGNSRQLEETLKLLLESAVRGSPHGSVQLSARRVPESNDPGHILFTVADTGSGYPPVARSSVALAKTWEMAGKHGGYMGVEAGPNGVSVAFSAHFSLVDEAESETAQIPHVLLVCEDSAQRRELAKIIQDIPCRLNETANDREMLACQSIDPASLLVTCGRFAMPSASDMVTEFIRLANAAGFATCHVLAITRDDSQWKLLKPGGFTHAMLEPVDPEALRATIRSLIQGEVPAGENIAEAKNDPEIPDLTNIFSGAKTCEPLDIPEYSPENLSKNIPGNISKDIPETNSKDSRKNIFSDAGDAPEIVDLNLAIPMPAADNDSQDAITDTPLLQEEGIADIPDILASNSEKGEESDFAEPDETDRKEPDFSDIFAVDDIGPDAASEIPGKIIETAESENHDDLMAANDADNAVPEKTDDKGPETVEPSQSAAEEHKEPENPGAGQHGPDQIRSAGDPILDELINRLEQALAEASAGFANKNCSQVDAATADIARQAEGFGQRNLARLALCVERAAKANDLTAIKDLLPELANALERFRITVTQQSWRAGK